MRKETHEQAVKRGKKSKASGAIFEKRVRSDLEYKGWIVDKFTNTIKEGKLVPCQNRWNYFTKSLMMASGGFPDFKCHKRTTSVDMDNNMLYEVIGVEAKSNGILKPEEKEKCFWYLDNQVFSKILIASKEKIKNRVHIKYHDFIKKYGGKNGS